MRTRLLALGAAAILAVLVALPGAAAAAAGQSSGSSAPLPAAVSKTSAGHSSTQHDGTTVTGPRMCKCTVNSNNVLTNGSDFKYPSSVTVSQTTNLTHQVVQVSWTGFTPSDDEGDGPIYASDTTLYPVMVAECKGYHPASPNNCDDAQDNGVDQQPGYQNNPAFAVTAPNGTGETDVQVLTSLQSQSPMLCDNTHPCSLVVVPAQGGLSNQDCANHSQDAGDDPQALGNEDLEVEPSGDPWQCSWAKRIVVPLRFAPAPNDCPLRLANFSAEGSPMLADAMTQWQTGICTGANSVEIAYNGTNNEDEARSDFQAGLTDVAFTTLPLTGQAAHPYTYAPVAVSAVSVAFYVDNYDTGTPYTTIKLTPLLLAKQLTTSYNYGGYQCIGPNSSPKPCDSAVNHTIPTTIFEDPDFLKYNPGPWNFNTGQSLVAFDTPDIVAGNSDMTWVTTGWIAASKQATAFLNGAPSGGVYLNSYYRGTKYPILQITPRDPFSNMSNQDQPQFPLYDVTDDLLNGQQPGVDPAEQQPGQSPPGWPVQEPGERELFAVLDEGDAALDLLPVAYLQNAAGKFVQPTDQSMLAAVKDMTPGPGGTLSMNFATKDPAAYPLTMVIYAVVPTGGISKAKASAIARFLDYVANQGQQPGSDPGNLAPGYAPLPQSLRQQTLTAAYDVLHQTGDSTKKASSSTPTPTTSPTTSPSPSASPSKSPSPSATPKPSASSTPTAHSIAVSFSSPDGAGMSWVVLALILAGAVLLVTGPAALVAASPAARAAIGSAVRRISLLGSGRRSHWRGVPRPTRRRNS